ncbi:MAG: hypothetical protein U5K27_19080 [Desulfotignum sp.]|nr:hypothetical protein [Desulfotignum sp.]
MSPSRSFADVPELPDIGGKEKEYMKGKIKYTDEPMGKVKVIPDVLPSPEELALKDETVKVTKDTFTI